MAQTVAPAAQPFAWTLRLYDAVPLAAGWVGAMLGVGLYALFLVVEAALGRMAFVFEGNLLGTSGEALMTGLLCALLAYLCTATISAAREGPQAVSRLRHLLEGSDRELDALELDAARRPRGKLLIAGLGGALIALLVPFLETGSEPWNPYDWRLWSPESTWHRFLAPLIGWWMARLFAVMLIDSRGHSALARHIRAIDLLNLRPLVSFARLGLSNALRVVGLMAIFSLLLIDAARYGTMVLLIAGITVLSATTALLLPVRGVQRRIHAFKLAEIDRLNRAIRGDNDALRGSTLTGREATPSLADLVAYRGLVESAREWPFDTSTFVRFTLYLMIPLGSWLGGALVERLIDALID